MAENVYIGRTSFSDGFSFGFERSLIKPFLIDILINGAFVNTISRQMVSSKIDIVPIQTEVKTVQRYSTENDRLIRVNLFLPPAYDNSELYELIKKFDDYLNYEAYFYTCDDTLSINYIGVLKVIEKVAYFNSPIEVNCNLLEQLSRQRGLDVYYGDTEVNYLISQTTSTKTEATNVYRRLLNDIPQLYQNKSTYFGSKANLLEFGVLSTIYTYWENEAGDRKLVKDPYKLNIEGSLTSNEIETNKGYYPTSHIFYSLDSLTEEDLFPYVITLVKNTKPINVVIDGFSIDTNYNMNLGLVGEYTNSSYIIDIEAEL